MYWLRGDRAIPAELLPQICVLLKTFEPLDLLESQAERVAFKIPDPKQTSGKEFHKHVFQDVYAWAGECRTVPIAKGNSLSLDQSTSGRNCRSYFINSPASNICEGTILRDSANAPLTTLARSTLCILFARETDEHNVNSFESWL
jgi:hypothetical protein